MHFLRFQSVCDRFIFLLLHLFCWVLSVDLQVRLHKLFDRHIRCCRRKLLLFLCVRFLRCFLWCVKLCVLCFQPVGRDWIVILFNVHRWFVSLNVEVRLHNLRRWNVRRRRRCVLLYLCLRHSLCFWRFQLHDLRFKRIRHCWKFDLFDLLRWLFTFDFEVRLYFMRRWHLCCCRRELLLELCMWHDFVRIWRLKLLFLCFKRVRCLWKFVVLHLRCWPVSFHFQVRLLVLRRRKLLDCCFRFLHELCRRFLPKLHWSVILYFLPHWLRHKWVDRKNRAIRLPMSGWLLLCHWQRSVHCLWNWLLRLHLWCHFSSKLWCRKVLRQLRQHCSRRLRRWLFLPRTHRLVTHQLRRRKVLSYCHRIFRYQLRCRLLLPRSQRRLQDELRCWLLLCWPD